MAYTKQVRKYCLNNQGTFLNVSLMKDCEFSEIPYKTLLKILNRLEEEKLKCTVGAEIGRRQNKRERIFRSRLFYCTFLKIFQICRMKRFPPDLSGKERLFAGKNLAGIAAEKSLWGTPVASGFFNEAVSPRSQPCSVGRRL